MRVSVVCSGLLGNIMAEMMKSVIAPKNCAVREYTANGVSVGRCWHFVPNDMCPRHGDVSVVMEHYRETGKLTDGRSDFSVDHRRHSYAVHKKEGRL